MSIAAYITPVESPTCFEALMQMIEIADYHKKHPQNQTTPYIVVTREAIWTAWRPHIWRQVLWHIIIQVRKCVAHYACAQAPPCYVMVSSLREWFVGKSATSIICTSAWDMLGRVSTGKDRYCSYMFPRLRKMIGYGRKKFVLWLNLSPRDIILHQVKYSHFSIFHHYIILVHSKYQIFSEKGGRILNTYLISLFFFSQKLPRLMGQLS